ncbi:MAG: carbamoyltransferase [Kiritimatiellia bacterium]
MNILGISAFYHDSAAALVQDGRITAAAQEERFSRRKHDPGFPENAVRYCLAQGGVKPDGLDAVVFYDKPIVKFARILETCFSVAPAGLRSFMKAVPLWLKEKLWIPYRIETSLEKAGLRAPREMFFTEHHESHAASAFYPSPFERAAILTVDGVGEWATSAVGRGQGKDIEILKELRFPHSLGLLYSAFTYFTGFRVNSGEYKLMGLAPYGEPRYEKTILDNLLDIREDGSFRLNMKYFGYLDGLTMTNAKFARLFDGPPRKPESDITRREMDLASSVQKVTEDIVMKMAKHAKDITGEKNLCMAGGVALNCVANGKILRTGMYDNLWIQPASGDAGGALGAGLFAWHAIKGHGRTADGLNDRMRGSFLGPAFRDREIAAFLEARNIPFRRLEENNLPEVVAGLIDDQKVVGICRGRMEFGPRALGARSILGDPRSTRMQSVMNLKIKHRESFRPFAPSCLRERAGEYFELSVDSPYMLFTAPVRKERRIAAERRADEATLIERVNTPRSDIPAVTHVDYSARVQTVDRSVNPDYYDLIKAFEKRTNCGLVVNTSFNVRGEPIVCTPEDAYACFMRTEMDHLLLGSFLLDKKEQPAAEAELFRGRDNIPD